MKKLFILILIGAAGYLSYEYLIREKQVLDIKANKLISTSYSMDIEAPALSPANSGSIQGTVKNISNKAVSNILLKYKLDGKPVEANIYYLEPGEEKSFSTQTITVRGAGVPFYLEEFTYE